MKLNIKKYLCCGFKSLFSSKKEDKNKMDFGSELVILSNKVKPFSEKPQIIKLGEKYFKIKELG